MDWPRTASVISDAEAIATDEFIDLRIDEGDLFGWFFILILIFFVLLVTYKYSKVRQRNVA